MRHRAIQFNAPRQPNRGIISDDMAGILVIVLALPAIALWRGWQYLRTGR